MNIYFQKYILAWSSAATCTDLSPAFEPRCRLYKSLNYCHGPFRRNMEYFCRSTCGFCTGI
ncbi:MAG: hypothetical protein CMB97_01620 [Flavobacteriaceae bacterium]|nr:hypothetical protein [Flavobacteriaceae bacterium]